MTVGNLLSVLTFELRGNIEMPRATIRNRDENSICVGGCPTSPSIAASRASKAPIRNSQDVTAAGRRSSPVQTATLERNYVELSEAYERLAKDFRKNITLSLALCRKVESVEGENAVLRKQIARLERDAMERSDVRVSRPISIIEPPSATKSDKKCHVVLPLKADSPSHHCQHGSKPNASGRKPALSVSSPQPHQLDMPVVANFDLQREVLKSQLSELVQQIDSIRLRSDHRLSTFV